MKTRSILLIAALTAANFLNAQQNSEVKSPDKKTAVKLENKNGQVVYNVIHEGKAFIESSPLGITTSIGDFTNNLKPAGTKTKSINEKYELNRSKVSKVNYTANELVASYINTNKDTIKFIFRVSNTDVAFSYMLPKTKKQTSTFTIDKEFTGFKLPSGSTAFITPQSPTKFGWKNTKPSYEEKYVIEQPVGSKSQYGLGFTYPALFHVKDNTGWVLISETGTTGKYAGTRLAEPTAAGLYEVAFPMEGENNGVGATTVSATLPFSSPWKTITIGKTLEPIIASTVATDVVKPLVQSKNIFKPGKASWSWIMWQDESCNYNDQITFIDVAAAANCEYILIDALWDNQIGTDKMIELFKYAHSKNVEVMLWYNSNGNWNDAPQTPKDRMNTKEARRKEMQWMQQNGVKGIKVDFFGGDKQVTMQLYEDILTDAAEFGLAVNFHGTTLPRGWERMYPSYMTSEAALASENLIFEQAFCDSYPVTATIYPFTRNAVAAMDFGPVFLSNRLNREENKGNFRRTTDAFEIATSVLFFSPLQHWGITPNDIKNKPAYLIDFLKEVPTVWDETKLIDGYPGKYCVLARRKNNTWYIAAVNGQDTPLNIDIKLPMLKGKEVKIIKDGKGSESAYEIKKLNSDTYPLNLAAHGGSVLVGK
ncbi:glycoside hydrolase family 97 protein [Flavobacterium sp. Sd200]|uniref:glycoside hydrolase family 97 protein n=1 Tax=Flavobacterium sp. Sd200 TaxID=2692211 RepID=UPI001368FD18|nr:glycoside hydrolase family 97 protein [Flavobacterium sp. Sd200]MXN92175.1 glycoside hydrolase family 97 protein [Flavobacterium sp. Sd200]